MESIGSGRQAAQGVAVLGGSGPQDDSASHLQQPARPAIVTPWVDFLCVGGLAVVPFAVIYALNVPFSQYR